MKDKLYIFFWAIKSFDMKHRTSYNICIIISLLLGFMSLGACSTPTAYDQVVESYAHDSLKREAAVYLATYSKFHYGVARNIVDANGQFSNLSPMMFASDSVYRAYMDSLHYYLKKGKPVLDEDTITEAYLKKNIDLAFDSWRKPWAKGVSFADFCRYILPYRNGDEELTEWRDYFKQKYEHLITDSMMENANTKDLAEFMMRQIRKHVKYSTRFNSITKGFLTPKEAEKIGYLECQACANYATMVMRACGIPCELIEIHWRFTEVPHSSVMFPKTASNPKPFRLTIGDELTYMGEAKDTMASYRTWAYQYEVNKDLLRLVEDENVPKSYLKPLCRTDVTSLMSTTYSIRLAVPDSLKDKPELFLCRFHEWKWYPIREGFVDGDSVEFKHATIRQLYRLGYAVDGEVKTFGCLFTLLGNGKIQKYDQTGENVHFKIAYSCDSTETLLTRNITTTFCWDKANKWKAVVRQAPLWGFNKTTGEYKLFEESMRGPFIPVFHLYEVDLPMWTAFYSKELPRPVGFICRDPNTGEGYMMQF